MDQDFPIPPAVTRIVIQHPDNPAEYWADTWQAQILGDGHTLKLVSNGLGIDARDSAEYIRRLEGVALVRAWAKKEGYELEGGEDLPEKIAEYYRERWDEEGNPGPVV